MAVLKQTSPTAWPSAPRPKPSITVPSASTRSAVGLWSGQAEAFSDVVMSPLHSRAKACRQSGKIRIHMLFFGWPSASHKEPDHQDFIEILPVSLQGPLFAAVFQESRLLIEPQGGLIDADDTQ